MDVKADNNIRAVLDAGVKHATIFGKAWDFHVVKALETSLQENLNMISDSISYLVSQGLEVIFDAEHFFDGYKSNRDYALKVLEKAAQAGAVCLVLCDTNGGTLPWETGSIVEDIRQHFAVPWGFICITIPAWPANTLMAVKAVHPVAGDCQRLRERGNAGLCSNTRSGA